MSRFAETFEEYYRASDDPWGFRDRWYEQRKRDLLVAALPRQAYENAWEIGCSNGELAAALAPRCRRLLATDGNERALEIARRRLADFSQIEVRQLWQPLDWPEGAFDLIVFSELGYYLDESALAETCLRAKASLREDGTLLACHWRAPIAGCDMTGDDVHRLIGQTFAGHRQLNHSEPDFLLEAWSPSPRSVAQREGLR